MVKSPIFSYIISGKILTLPWASHGEVETDGDGHRGEAGLVPTQHHDTAESRLPSPGLHTQLPDSGRGVGAACDEHRPILESEWIFC